MKKLRDFQNSAKGSEPSTLTHSPGEQQSSQQDLLHYLRDASVSLRSWTEMDSLLQHIALVIATMPGFRSSQFYLHDCNDFCLVAPDDVFPALQPRLLPEILTDRLMHEKYRVGHSYLIPADATSSEQVVVKRLFVSIDAENIPSQATSWQRQDVVVVPLSDEGGVLFGLFIFADPLQGYPPPSEWLFLLEMFASQVCVLLERNHLHEEIRRISEERVALIEVGRALSSPKALSDQQTVYRTIYEQMKHLMPVDAFFVSRYDSAQDLLLQEYAVESNFVDRVPAFKILPPELTRFLWAEKKYILFSIEEFKRFLKEEVRRGPGDFRALWERPVFSQMQTVLFLAIKYADEPVGLICVQSSQPDCYRREHLRMLEEIGVQAALAMKCSEMYTQLSSALQQAQESERLKNHFLMTASHELRTPLTAIQGYLELLDDFSTTLTEESKARFVGNARLACEELVLLLGNVMDASRVEQDKIELRPGPVVLEEAVCAIAEILEPIITRERRTLEIQVAHDLSVRADDLRLRQILLNLLGNALKYTPAPTSMEVCAEELSYEELCERYPAIQELKLLSPFIHYVIVAVKDWGPGIAPEKQGRLFTKFMRLDSAINSVQRGAGLGLYLCRQLTEAMNGHIWLESTGIPGEGACFFVALPNG